MYLKLIVFYQETLEAINNALSAKIEKKIYLICFSKTNFMIRIQEKYKGKCIQNIYF